MKIKRFHCERFGGISGKDLEFKDGINVILGPNEAGKSTIVEAIYNTLFRKTNLNRRSKDDIEFVKRWMPYQSGDSIKASIVMEHEGKEYRITREWGITPQVMLEYDGNLLKSENAVQQALNKILRYGEKTYYNVVFSKQNIKDALLELKNPETSGTVSAVLRQAVINLDGVSIDKLKIALQAKINELGGHWDIANNLPERNRGINDPWAKGVGAVLKNYYEKESIKAEIQRAVQVEQEYAQKGQEIKDINIKRQKCRDYLKEYEPIESQIIQRNKLELKLDALRKEAGELKTVNTEYPTVSQKLNFAKENLKKAYELQEKLKAELAAAQKVKDAQSVKDTLGKIKDIELHISKLREELKGSITVTDEAIEKLNSLQHKKMIASAAMDAGTLIGSLLKSNEMSVFITKDLDVKQEITAGTTFKAKGYAKIEVGDSVELEIKAGEIDFESLREEYNRASAAFDELLRELGVKSLEQAKAINIKNKQIQKDIDGNLRQITGLLAGKQKDELERIVKDAEGISARSLDEINVLIAENQKFILKTTGEVSGLEQKISDWKKKYGDLDKLFDILIQINLDIKEQEKALDNLARLPDGFSSSEEFLEKLRKVRSYLKLINDKYDQLKDKYNEITNILPEESSEELKARLKDIERDYEVNLSQLKGLLKVQEVLNRHLSALDNNSFKPLTKAFSRYLSILTLNRYDIAELSESFDVGISSKTAKNLPPYLLSVGTYDDVFLSLRLAIIHQLFTFSSFLVLDDCLVNLDPDRKMKAIEVIQEFGKQHQVIFSTCEPTTAESLGGNIINI